MLYPNICHLFASLTWYSRIKRNHINTNKIIVSHSSTRFGSVLSFSLLHDSDTTLDLPSHIILIPCQQEVHVNMIAQKGQYHSNTLVCRSQSWTQQPPQPKRTLYQSLSKERTSIGASSRDYGTNHIGDRPSLLAHTKVPTTNQTSSPTVWLI